MTSWAATSSPPFSPIRLSFRQSPDASQSVVFGSTPAIPNYKPPKYPEGWDDDRLMAIRFADAPSAAVDPEGRIAHINWWLEAMRMYARQINTLHLMPDEVQRHFTRSGGMYPECIPEVLQELHNQGQTASVQQLLNPPKLLSHIWSFVASGISQVFSSNSKSTTDGPFYFVEMARERSGELLEQLLGSCFNEVDRIIDFRHIKTLLKPKDSTSESNRHDLDAQILLKQLAADCKIAIFYSQANSMFVKVTSNARGTVEPVTDSDRNVANLKYTMEYLVEHLAILEAKRNEKMKEVREALRSGRKTLAKYHLAAAKALKKEEDTRSQQFLNLQTLLLRISSSHSNREVFGAMKQASQAVVQIQKECGLDADSAGEFMAELEETLADASDLDQALSTDVTGEDIHELEEELDMLDAMESEKQVAELELELPSVPRMTAVSPAQEQFRQPASRSTELNLQ